MGVTGKLRNMTSIYLQSGGKLLLLYRQGSRVVNNVWIGSAGGHFEENELNDPQTCVLRELEEELAITSEMITDLQLRYVTLRRSKGEIRQNYYFFAKLKGNTEPELHSDEGILQWFAPEDLHELEMPFSAKYMLEHFVQTGRYTCMVYVGVADGEKVVFTELAEF